MNLFRPYRAGEPRFDARGRLLGIDRYQDLLGRSWKSYAASGLMTLLGFLPFAAGVAFAALSRSVLLLLGACVLGGSIAGPSIACLYDTILRSLRDAPGSWRQNYHRANVQNRREAWLPGIATCLYLGVAVFAGLVLFVWSPSFPSGATLFLFLFSALLFFLFATLYWAQLALFRLRGWMRLRNSLLFLLRHFWQCLGMAALQLAWWLLTVLFAPWSLLALPFVGCWFSLFVALFFVYKPLDRDLAIEQRIAAAYPEQTPRYN